LFRRSDRRDETPDERVLAARNAATQGFLALDDEQRAVADAVRAAEELGTGRRMAQEWADVAAVGDAATSAYLAATQEHPLDGSRPAAGARSADEKALQEIERAREAIRRFRAGHSRALDEAAFALTNLPRTVQEARTALVSARAAVQRADAAGVRSRRAEERLAEAEGAAVQLDAAGAGLRERRQTAQRTLDLARSAAGLAEEAPRTAEQVRSALSSIATRRSAAATKAGRIEPAMSSLRREFSEPCSRDLTGAHALAREAIADADRAIAQAGRQAEAGDWDEAADQVTAARSALSRAEDRHDAVTDRRAALRDVRADPARRAADTRFVLRDAQRLVVDRGLVPDFGAILDAQSVRLTNAQERLTGVHPDYWLYLTELRGIRERVRDVVARARTTPPRR
jgi:chromosome segregation ATPase